MSLMEHLVMFLWEPFRAELAWEWFLSGVRPLMDGHGAWFLAKEAAVVAEKGLLVPIRNLITGSHNLVTFHNLFRGDLGFQWGCVLVMLNLPILSELNSVAFDLFFGSWNIECPEYWCNFLLSLKFWNLCSACILFKNHFRFCRLLQIIHSLNNL